MSEPNSTWWQYRRIAIRARCALSKLSPLNFMKRAQRLKRCRIRTVALESTGIYWLALYEVLEQYGFEVRVVNARHVKHVPGRSKTDVLDCQWIQKLHSFGLLNGSFRPDQQIRKLRTYERLRDNLGVNNTQAIHHLQKALFEMNVRLSNVISDVTGETGLRDPAVGALAAPRYLLSGHHAAVRAIAFSADDKRLASVGGDPSSSETVGIV